MKKRIINLILILVALAALGWCVMAKGLQWFLGFIPLLAACYGLLDLNTDYIRDY